MSSIDPFTQFFVGLKALLENIWNLEWILKWQQWHRISRNVHLDKQSFNNSCWNECKVEASGQHVIVALAVQLR